MRPKKIDAHVMKKQQVAKPIVKALPTFRPFNTVKEQIKKNRRQKYQVM